MSLRLAVAHADITPDIRANGRHLRALMQQAAAAGARLVQFPECALSGYCKTEVADWAALDWACLREELERTAALAGALGLWVALGCAHRLTPPHRPRNSLYVIDDHGRVHGRYDKRLCSHSEITDWFSAGTDPLCFTVDGMRFGCALCIEACFPELFAAYEGLGADCVLLSAYSQDPFHGVLAQAHAGANCLWVSLCTPASCGAALPSRVIGPDGWAVAAAEPHARPGLLLADLDPADPRFAVALHKARPWRAAVRRGV